MGTAKFGRIQALASLVALAVSAALAQAGPAREIPPAYGPYTHLKPRDFASNKSFTSRERVVGAYYFYWYCIDTKEHITNPANGSDGLTDHPPTLEGFSYKSAAWHKKQLMDMEDAGIDVLLAVFWGAPSERAPDAELHWSYAGLGPLVEARDELAREGRHPPRIGLFYDTSTLQHNGWHEHIDLTTDYGKRWFYSTIRDFYSAIPPKDWAMMDGKPIVLLYAAAFAKNHDQTFVNYTKAEFKKEFGRELYLAPQDSWQVKGDNTCAWGGAFGVRNPGIGELGPGYNDSAVYGRTPQIAPRDGGKFYEANWIRFLRRPSNFVMIETWSEFHEGTEICESREYGRQYINLTRKYADLFKQGWAPPWPSGPFARAKELAAAPGLAYSGLKVIKVEDGKAMVESRDGHSCWACQPFNGRSSYLYFQADDSFKWARTMNVTVQVEYLDGAPGWLNLEYDGSDASAPFHGAYSASQAVELKGGNQWRTATFKLPQARFLNSENGGADFRLVGQTPSLLVREVKLKHG